MTDLGGRREPGERGRGRASSRALRGWASPELLLGLGVFVAAALSRTVWLSHAPFHPDESTALWMALDALRHPSLPDHGLVSSYVVFQPPGLVWLTMPFVGIGGGRPEFVIVGFGLLNAAALAFFATNAARAWGTTAAAVTSAFAIVGPDAFMSAWVWHPSLYTGAMALLLGAAIRLRSGSRWWAVLIVAIPGLFALIHYSGFVLYGPAAVAIALSRRRLRELWQPLGAALSLSLLAWVPFLVFEWRRGWVDIRTIFTTTEPTGGLSRGPLATIRGYLADGRFALEHLGEGMAGPVLLTPVITLLALAAVVYAIVRRRFPYPVVLGSAVLASGLAIQMIAGMAGRTDVLMMWLLPLYLLAGWLTAQLRWIAVPVTVGAAVLVLGSIDLDRAVESTAPANRLSSAWALARAGAPPSYDASQFERINAFYLACDPPYGWGSEIWYLREVLQSGEGIRAGVRAGAFRTRDGVCTSRDTEQSSATAG